MVGILVSSWDGLFSGAMLVSGRVVFGDPNLNLHHKPMACILGWGGRSNYTSKTMVWLLKAGCNPPQKRGGGTKKQQSLKVAKRLFLDLFLKQILIVEFFHKVHRSIIHLAEMQKTSVVRSEPRGASGHSFLLMINFSIFGGQLCWITHRLPMISGFDGISHWYFISISLVFGYIWMVAHDIWWYPYWYLFRFSQYDIYNIHIYLTVHHLDTRSHSIPIQTCPNPMDSSGNASRLKLEASPVVRRCRCRFPLYAQVHRTVRYVVHPWRKKPWGSHLKMAPFKE